MVSQETELTLGEVARDIVGAVVVELSESVLAIVEECVNTGALGLCGRPRPRFAAHAQTRSAKTDPVEVALAVQGPVHAGAADADPATGALGSTRALGTRTWKRAERWRLDARTASLCYCRL